MVQDSERISNKIGVPVEELTDVIHALINNNLLEVVEKD